MYPISIGGAEVAADNPTPDLSGQLAKGVDKAQACVKRVRFCGENRTSESDAKADVRF